MKMVILSSIFITLALVFYSLGIWSERIARYLKLWHLVMFWTGFAFDMLGTLHMHFISTRPFNFLDLHTLPGQIALWLMLAHAIWATYVIRKGSEDLHKKFHRYSLVVWLVWLIPYCGGMWLAMGR